MAWPATLAQPQDFAVRVRGRSGPSTAGGSRSRRPRNRGLAEQSAAGLPEERRGIAVEAVEAPVAIDGPLARRALFQKQHRTSRDWQWARIQRSLRRRLLRLGGFANGRGDIGGDQAVLLQQLVGLARIRRSDRECPRTP